MGHPKQPSKVKLICALCYNDLKILHETTEELICRYGAVEDISDPFKFTFTTYYQNEMGHDLEKIFYSFKNLIWHEEIVAIKLFTNDIEAKFSYQKKRTVNIDPGYLEAAKLVLATTKNYTHRIFLGQGVYGDVQLYFRNGEFHTSLWTYPDYRDVKTIAFFDNIRKKYLLDIHLNKSS